EHHQTFRGVLLGQAGAARSRGRGDRRGNRVARRDAAHAVDPRAMPPDMDAAAIPRVAAPVQVRQVAADADRRGKLDARTVADDARGIHADLLEVTGATETTDMHRNVPAAEAAAGEAAAAEATRIGRAGGREGRGADR